MTKDPVGSQEIEKNAIMNDFDTVKPAVTFKERLRLRLSVILMRMLLKHLRNDASTLTQLGIAEFLLGSGGKLT